MRRPPEPFSDTIAAISTPPGEGGIGIVRLSGPEAIAVADRIFRPKDGGTVARQKGFTARYGHVVRRGRAVDEAVLLLMRAPKSYTREDVVEISVHGGTAAVTAALEAALAAGCRSAGPGEFTKRAFLNGRIDLVQAEAVLELIRSRTERGRRWAAARLGGGLSERAAAFRETLVEVLSRLEASIDFPEDLPEPLPADGAAGALRAVAAGARELLAGAGAGILAQRGLSVVLAGPPNAGKSSLMNALARADRVIVTPIPGTTRDVVEEELDLRGFPVRLADTAGIQDTEHPIEREGIERSRRKVSGADLLVAVLDVSRPLEAGTKELLRSFRELPLIVALNKSDLPARLDPNELALPPGTPMVPTSCVGGGGVEKLEDEIFRFICGGKAQMPDEILISTARQKEALEGMTAAVEAAAAGVSQGLSPELVAVDVRLALDRLGELVGEIAPDEVLDALFSRFCIGK